MRAMMVVLVFVAGCAESGSLSVDARTDARHLFDCAETIYNLTMLCTPLPAPKPRCSPGDMISRDEHECMMAGGGDCKMSSTDIAICHSLSK